VIIIDLETTQLQASQKIVTKLWEKWQLKLKVVLNQLASTPLYCQLGIDCCGFSAAL